MSKIAKIFDLFLMVGALLFYNEVLAGISDDCHVLYKNSEIRGKLAITELIFCVPEGWKLPKMPKITVKSTKNIAKYNFEERIQKISPTEYRMSLCTELDEGEENSLELAVEIPLCSDICTIVSKSLTIFFDHTGASVPEGKGIALMILFALIGGVILNFMPCVLPVILMKLRSFFASNKKAAVFGTIAGNYVSFCAFTIFLMLIKTAGEQIGWGMHFQNPNFLKIIAIILFLLTLFSFEIIHFSPFVQFAVSEKHQVFLENFISSIVASIVAIPCTAPFLGTAAAFAIQGSLSDMALIFFSIATGFSLPYILALVMPISMPSGLGKYAGVIKMVTNCGILMAFLWVLYLLARQIGTQTIFYFAGCFVVAAVFFTKKHNKYGVLCLVLSLFTGVGKIPNNTTENASEVQLGMWVVEKSNENIAKIINGDIAKKRIVIFNISADWCLTCKYNKLNVLNNKEILELIKNKNILCIEADMTQKDDFLMRIISNYGRAGIPFTMVFGPNAKNGILLSEIPTVEELKKAIFEAGESLFPASKKAI